MTFSFKHVALAITFLVLSTHSVSAQEVYTFPTRLTSHQSVPAIRTLEREQDSTGEKIFKALGLNEYLTPAEGLTAMLQNIGNSSFIKKTQTWGTKPNGTVQITSAGLTSGITVLNKQDKKGVVITTGYASKTDRGSHSTVMVEDGLDIYSHDAGAWGVKGSVPTTGYRLRWNVQCVSNEPNAPTQYQYDDTCMVLLGNFNFDPQNLESYMHYSETGPDSEYNILRTERGENVSLRTVNWTKLVGKTGFLYTSPEFTISKCLPAGKFNVIGMAIDVDDDYADSALIGNNLTIQADPSCN